MMKAIFFFALLGLSLKAFSQGKPTVLNGQVPFSYTIKNSMQERFENMRNPSELRSEDKFSSMIHHEAMMLPPPVQLVDSVYNWAWDTLSGEWLTKRRTIDIAYDNRNNPISYTEQKWNGQTWDNTTKINLAYDSSNNLIYQVIQERKDSAWENSSNETYTYDEHNNQTSSATQEWYSGSWYNEYKTIDSFDGFNNLISRTSQDGSGSDWINSFQYLYTYDSLSNLILEVTRFWYQDENDWEDFAQVIYTYDSFSNLITELEQKWVIDAWINRELYVHTFDANDSLIHSVWKEWGVMDWIDRQNIYFTYDLDLHQTIETYQEWTVSGWENSARDIYTYNADKAIISRQLQLWNDTGDTWENYYQTIFTFGAYKNLTSLTNYIWDWQTGKWLKSSQGVIGYDDDNFLMYHVERSFNEDGVTIQDADSTHIYYHKVIVSDEKVDVEGEVVIFPNPSNGQFTVRGEHLQDIRIFNGLGQMVYSFPAGQNRTDVEINLLNTTQGVYTIQVYDGKNLVVRHLVVH